MDAVRLAEVVVKDGIMYNGIKQFCQEVSGAFDSIPQARRELLQQIAGYISDRRKLNKEVNLVYICTHNSRRSHFGQIWSKVASCFYGVEGVNTFSGGTEATAFNKNAIAALERLGFKIASDGIETNPRYRISFGEEYPPMEAFSKVYNDPVNPEKDFAAIMTCGEAEQNCPFIPGVELRVATTYEDPKHFDGTVLQDLKYDERCRQIAMECLFVFSIVNKKQ